MALPLPDVPLAWVRLCVSLSSTCLSGAVSICSFLSAVWIPKSSQGKSQENEGREGTRRSEGGGRWADPEPAVVGGVIPGCPAVP